jgi:large subunit ribosomal protein L6
MIGYKNYLMVRGVGYKFIKKNQYMSLHIGYSHNINIILSSDIKMKINRKTTLIKFQNENYAFLHGILSIIRNFKKPDVYKGKGLRYKKEKVILKEGKKKKVV